MKILADSGSTQCTWLMTGDHGTTVQRTAGINAVLHTAEQVREVLSQLRTDTQVRHVEFYGAGCGSQFPDATQRMHDALQERFPEARIGIHSDLTGAARALWGRGEGIACILGTGSNSCHCRGGEVVHNTPPLGYVLGDEGSGAALGKALLNGVFKGHIPLREEVQRYCSMSYEQIVRRVYGEPYANRFLASFSPFVAEHLHRPEVRELAAACFGDFARRNLTRYPAGLPLAFIGGVAAHFEALLREIMEQEGYRVERIVESPAEGLLKYHYGE